MNNYAVARVFWRIADLMEIKGESFFKIRAYRNAAETMQELTESLEVLAERGALQTIPGVGEAIAAKTREILATGTTKLYEQLKAEVPESLVELLKLPGFGPKKILTVWKELGVRTLDDLEAAVGGQRLRSVSGFSAKSEDNVAEAIASARRRRERTPIFVAAPYAEALARMFSETGAFTRLEIAGSVRRRKDLVGDINLVGVAPDAVRALEAVAAHAETSEVLSRHQDEICIRSQIGILADVRLAPSEAFGSSLQRYTGSLEHNALLGSRLPAGFTAPSEEEVYGKAGLAWIPPELREAGGEIEAAAARRLPRLIDVSDLRGILHAHSTWSDGSATVARMAETARGLGHEYFAITDHSKALTVAGGLDEARLRLQIAEVKGLNARMEGPFRILQGIECDILLDGSLDLPAELLEKLDVVIGSVHSHQRLDEETMTRRIIRALESGVIDILAHPTGRILGARDSYPVDFERVMDAAISNRVALEINAYPDRLDMNEVLARRVRNRGMPISLNPDAHRPDQVGMLQYGIGQARRAWLEPEEVINTWPLERLLRWLRTRER